MFDHAGLESDAEGEARAASQSDVEGALESDVEDCKAQAASESKAEDAKARAASESDVEDAKAQAASQSDVEGGQPASESDVEGAQAASQSGARPASESDVEGAQAASQSDVEGGARPASESDVEGGAHPASESAVSQSADDDVDGEALSESGSEVASTHNSDNAADAAAGSQASDATTLQLGQHLEASSMDEKEELYLDGMCIKDKTGKALAFVFHVTPDGRQYIQVGPNPTQTAISTGGPLTGHGDLLALSEDYKSDSDSEISSVDEAVSENASCHGHEEDL